MAQIEIKDETELQARSRIVTNAFRDNNNCIVLRVDTHISREKGINPFGFHFEIDKKKYRDRRRQIKRERITRWLAWVAYYHHKFGIRHLLLVSLLTGYVFLGGFMFNKLESPNELEDLKSTLVLMQGIIREFSYDAINLTSTEYCQKGNLTIAQDKMAKLIKRYYKEMLEGEGRFHGSVWHKAENLELHLMWYFSSATFYAMTLFTTIGYGTIACQTFWGRFLSIVYASIGIPLMLVTLGDVGEWFQRIITKCYIFVLIKFKQARGQKMKKPLDEIFLPVYLALLMVTLYIVFCTLIIKQFDHQEGNKPGIDFGSALYFVFISLTTIGLGDVMPFNIQYSPFLAAAFLLGLAMVSIVNTSIYAVLYELFFERVEQAENWLDRLHRQHHRPSGWRVFKDLEPCINTLVCSFPHFERSNRERLLTKIGAGFAQNNTHDVESGIAGILAQTVWATAFGGGRRNDDTMEEVNEEEQPHLEEHEEAKEETKPRKKVGFGALVRVRTNSDLAAHDKEHDHDQPVHRASIRETRRRAPTLGALGGFELNRFRKQRRRSPSISPPSDSD